MTRQLLWFVLFTVLGLEACSAPANTGCGQVRAAIDIGSGSTKMVVARVDACTHRIERELAPGDGEPIERRVPLVAGIVVDEDGRKVFSPATEAALLSVLTEFKAIGQDHAAHAFSAVATSAFRQIHPDFRTKLIQRIRALLEIPVRTIEQSEEARLGYAATEVALDAGPDQLLVWDIGGGSMQLSVRNNATREVEGHEALFANNEMVRFAFRCLADRGIAGRTSSNPLVTRKERDDPDNCLQAAIRKAESVTRPRVTPAQLDRFRIYPLVVGIGSVHFYSNCEITGQAPGCIYERGQLYEAIRSHAHLTDEELVSAGRASSISYAPLRITAGALTVGVMRAFGLERVRTLKIDMARGIVVEQAYW